MFSREHPAYLPWYCLMTVPRAVLLVFLLTANFNFEVKEKTPENRRKLKGEEAETRQTPGRDQEETRYHQQTVSTTHMPTRRTENQAETSQTTRKRRNNAKTQRQREEEAAQQTTGRGDNRQRRAAQQATGRCDNDAPTKRTIEPGVAENDSQGATKRRFAQRCRIFAALL